MMGKNCKFEQIGRLHWRCTYCKRSLGRKPIEYRLCPATLQPHIVKKVSNFAKAIAKHVKSGRKLRTQEQIDELLAICKSCPELNVKNVCKKCGCKITRAERYWSKLKWDSEHCPIKKW